MGRSVALLRAGAVVSRERYVTVEAPDTTVTIDFLEAGAGVTVTREKRNGRWAIVVSCKVADGSGYGWTEAEHTFPCPLPRRVRS